ncbi:hypothetical protein ACFXTO_035842 [Malus domestica]
MEMEMKSDISVDESKTFNPKPGSVIPARRRLVKSMILVQIVQMDTNEDFKSVFLEMLHREICVCVGHSLLCVGQSLQVQAATPKQIRELMKFDGLTNDEVKSHLQKLEVILHAISDDFFYTYM